MPLSFRPVACRPAIVPRAMRRGAPLLALTLVGPLAGCYSTRAVTTAPASGSTVLLDLTDAARVQLSDRIGASAARIEGIVETRSDSAYVLRISSVTYLTGQTNKWSGEPFTVPANLVARAQVREFSRSRTTMLGVGIAAALAALFATTDFLGLGAGEKTPIPTPGGES